MSQVLVTGTTGLVGRHLPCAPPSEPRISTVTVPTRRPLADTVGTYNPYDLQLTDALAQVTDPVDIVFCCLGTTRRKAGNKGALIHADYTLVVDIVLMGRRLDAQHVLVVSSIGANANSPLFYNRVKSEAGQALIAQNWPRLTIIRPSTLLGDRDKQRTNEMFLVPSLRLLPGNWKSIEARDVVRAILAEASAPEHEGVSAPTSSELREGAG